MTRFLLVLTAAALGGFAVGHWFGITAIPGRIMDAHVTRAAEAAGGHNRMLHRPLVGAQSRAVVRPSADLIYSLCPFDLSDGPVLIEAPVAGPYWSLSIFDGRTDTAAVFGNADFEALARVVLIPPSGASGPIPTDAVTVTPPTLKGTALIRIGITDRSDYPRIKRDYRDPADCRVRPMDDRS